jgi:hypothetical protein
MLPAGRNVSVLVHVSDFLGAEAIGRRSGLSVNSTDNGSAIIASVNAFNNISANLPGAEVDALLGVLRDASAALGCKTPDGRPCVADGHVMPLAEGVLRAVQASAERLEITERRAEALASALVPLAGVTGVEVGFFSGVLSTLGGLVRAVEGEVGA